MAKCLRIVAKTPDKSSSLEEVYKQRILALFRTPLGTGEPDSRARRGWARNRTCGDEVTFYTLTGGETIERCWQDTAGCAISTATASLLVEALAGKTPVQARNVLRMIHELVIEGKEVSIDNPLEILRAVHSLPSRHDCVGVALRAASESLGKEGDIR